MDSMYDKLFEGNAWASLHDALLEVDGKERTKEEVRQVFEGLPFSIKLEGLNWGLNDTEFRDVVIRYLKRS